LRYTNNWGKKKPKPAVRDLSGIFRPLKPAPENPLPSAYFTLNFFAVNTIKMPPRCGSLNMP
jgi:hypothetical protein